jgi:hypothetical protein
VSFPLGDVSFADAVVAYDPVVTADNLPAEEVRDPSTALGPPNFDTASTSFAGQAVTLGNNGRLTLQFLDNAVIGDGTAEPDLWIFEVGSEVEDTFVEVSVDGSTWVPVGKVTGGTCGVNLDAFGIGPEDRFTFVRLTDDPNEGDVPDVSANPSPGADIDALGAISTVRVPTPLPGPTTPPTPPTAIPPTAIPPTLAPPTSGPATVIPPTAIPPTSMPPTPVPATAIPGTTIPPSAVPPSTVTAGQTPTGPGTENTCNCEELAGARATIAAQATRIAELEGGNPPTTSEASPEAQIVLNTDTPQVRVGEVVRVSAGVTGLGQPVFSVGVRDADMAGPVELITIDSTGQVERREGGSRVLELEDAVGGADGLELTLQAVAPGETEMTVSATGEVRDASGAYVGGGAASDPLQIAVVDATAGIPPETGPETGQTTPAGGDFITPDSAECTATPRTLDALQALVATPEQAATDALLAAMAIPGVDVPAGQPADAATVEAIRATYRQMIACFNAGNDLAAYALWTDNALRQVWVPALSSDAPTPLAEGDRIALRITQVQLLPDGQVIAVWDRQGPSPSVTAVQRLVRQNEQYLVDETIDIMVPAPAVSDAAAGQLFPATPAAASA